MCRWIAYSGRRVPLGRYVVEPERSLVTQSLGAWESTLPTNGDGFGMGWYGDHDEPGLYREVRPAWADENLLYLARHIVASLFFAHVRASTGTPTSRPNCHPFAAGRWLFMHNGFIGDWTRVRRQVEQMIPDGLYPLRQGSTDSEAVFLAMVGAGLDADPVAAAARTIAAVARLVRQTGVGQRMRFTAALSDGREIYAFRYALNDHANTLYYRILSDGVLLVSEPLDEDRRHWTPAPENSVLRVGPDSRVEVQPFLAH